MIRILFAAKLSATNTSISLGHALKKTGFKTLHLSCRLWCASVRTETYFRLGLLVSAWTKSGKYVDCECAWADQYFLVLICKSRGGAFSSQRVNPLFGTRQSPGHDYPMKIDELTGVRLSDKGEVESFAMNAVIRHKTDVDPCGRLKPSLWTA